MVKRGLLAKVRSDRGVGSPNIYRVTAKALRAAGYTTVEAMKAVIQANLSAAEQTLLAGERQEQVEVAGQDGKGRPPDLSNGRNSGRWTRSAVRISRRSQLKFAEFATGWSTVNQIARAYEAEGFESDPDQADVGGARRTTCASFERQIDARSGNQQRRLLNVYLDAIETWGRQEDGSLPKGGLDLVHTLQRDGVPIGDDGRLSGRIPADNGLNLGDFRLLRDPGVLEEHLERMYANVDRDTPAAIGAAKELVESVCKLILEDLDVTYAPSASLPDLYRSVAQELRLSRESVSANAKGSEAAQRVLQGLVTSVQNLAELRNALGVGHGRAQRVPALERHARLAVNASRTLAEFLLETWHERRRLQPGGMGGAR